MIKLSLSQTKVIYYIHLTVVPNWPNMISQEIDLIAADLLKNDMSKRFNSFIRDPVTGVKNLF